MEGRLHKLGRGIANIATGPGELLRTPEMVGRRDGYLSGMTVGILQGEWNALVRETVGVVEVLTWYVSFPKKGFEPLLSPEFVWGQGNWSE